MLPFIESKIENQTFIREFKNSTDSGDFHWHRDREDRIVKSLETTDWKIQLDDELPKSLNDEVFIPMGVWHRIIKGDGDLKIILQKIF
jgi:hypothetical protein